MQDKPVSEKKTKKTDKKRQFGCGKGIFTSVAYDFDNELEMFHEYSK